MNLRVTNFPTRWQGPRLQRLIAMVALAVLTHAALPAANAQQVDPDPRPADPQRANPQQSPDFPAPSEEEIRAAFARDPGGIGLSGIKPAEPAEPSAVAPSIPVPVPISVAGTSFGLEQLISIAVTTHPAIAMKRLEQIAAGSLKDAARLQFFPTPSVSVDSLHGRQATVFRLSQPLWTGGRLTADLASADLKRLRAEAAVGDAQFTLAIKVVTLYQSFLLQSGRIESQRKGTVKLEQLVVMIERRVKSGVSAQIDLDLARSRLAQARSDLIALAGSQRSVVAQLSQAIGRPLQEGDIVRETFASLDGGGRFAFKKLAFPAVIERALLSSTALRLAQVDAQIARNEIAQTRALLWPTVALRAEHQAGSYDGSQASGNRVFISLQYTPGAGASVIPQAAAAESRAAAADQVVLTARRDVADKVESEWLDFQSASARIPELEKTRSGSSDVLDSSVRLFVTGRRTWLDLLNSVRELMQTEQLEVDAQATAVGSSYRLGLLAGESLWSREGVNP